jgi:ketosteroid isomerase-like protein
MLLLIATSPQAPKSNAPGAMPLVTATGEAVALREEVNAANRRWVDATRRQDFTALREIMAPDYFVIFNDGERADLNTWMTNFRKFRMRDCGAIITNFRVAGADTVEATVSAYWDAVLSNGKPFRETYVARDTWKRRGGRWVVVQRDVNDMRLLK